MVWILRFMSAKTVFSLYTHPAAKKNSGIWKEYNQLKMDMPYNNKDYAYPF